MRQIAAKVPCGLSTVVRTLKRFSETNFIADRRRSGHDQEKHLYVKTATRGLLATDHVILNHDQVMWTTPELELPLLTTTPYQREDVSALDRFNVHRYPTRRVFSDTGLEFVTRQTTVLYLYHSSTAAKFVIKALG
ncbi:uncharacterized protein TNCV_443991 [Trichonephila clavipes]|nr:uncharacterized protein TNCV_443991 [Trichonephila clavipes]